jgi:hypothetical protein
MVGNIIARDRMPIVEPIARMNLVDRTMISTKPPYRFQEPSESADPADPKPHPIWEA